MSKAKSTRKGKLVGREVIHLGVAMWVRTLQQRASHALCSRIIAQATAPSLAPRRQHSSFPPNPDHSKSDGKRDGENAGFAFGASPWAILAGAMGGVVAGSTLYASNWLRTDELFREVVKRLGHDKDGLRNLQMMMMVFGKRVCADILCVAYRCIPLPGVGSGQYACSAIG